MIAGREAHSRNTLRINDQIFINIFGLYRIPIIHKLNSNRYS